MSLTKRIRELNGSWRKLEIDSVFTLADTIRNRMTVKGMTAKELSIQSGVSYTTINNILAVRDNPSLRTLCKIAHTLNLAIELNIKEEK